MMLKKILPLILVFTHFISISQEGVKINYTDAKIKDLIDLSIKKKSSVNITIYSIQLKGSEKPEIVRSVKNQYQTLFQSELIDEVFEPPYFKVITGAYLDHKKAEQRLKEIINKFKSAFILKREISIEKFKNYQKTNYLNSY